jgi:hypothetical protein
MADVNQSEILGYKMKTPEEFFEKARIIAKQLDWMAEKGYESHPITGKEPTYEDRMNEPRLLANRIITPDGTMLQSYHRHDYKEYLDANGLEYMVDGGLEYQRTNVHDDAPHTNASVYDTDPHEVIRDAFHWGTRGKDGRQPLVFKPISSLSNMHIHNIIMTQTHVPDHIGNAFVNEELYRRDNGICIEDTE